MTFNKVPPAEWVRPAQLPLMVSCQTNVGSAMFRQPEDESCGRSFTNLYEPRTSSSGFYDGGVFLSNSCIMS